MRAHALVPSTPGARGGDGNHALWTLGHPTDEADWRTPLPPSAPVPRREVLAGNAKWARDYLAPWVQRRLRGESSGDLLTAKRPDVTPFDQQEA